MVPSEKDEGGKVGQLKGELGAREAHGWQLLPAEAHYAKDPLPSTVTTVTTWQ